MLASRFRPIARTALRSPIPSASSSSSSSSSSAIRSSLPKRFNSTSTNNGPNKIDPDPRHWSLQTRNLIVGGATMIIGGGLLLFRGDVRNDSRSSSSPIKDLVVGERGGHDEWKGGSGGKSSDGVSGDEKIAEKGKAIAEEKIHQAEEEKAEAGSEDAASQGAFNPDTGEINWDCPCLGGMADGPCGPQFKEAFSCFIYSEAEPKGIDCVEKFKGMQDCFREHPDIYGEEIDDDESPQGEGSEVVGHASGEGDIPKLPNAEPPQNSPILETTHDNTMSKGVQKLQPKANRTQPGGDKSADHPSPSSGDGTA